MQKANLSLIINRQTVPATDGGLHNAHASQLAHVARLALRGSMAMPKRASCIPSPGQQLQPSITPDSVETLQGTAKPISLQKQAALCNVRHSYSKPNMRTWFRQS